MTYRNRPGILLALALAGGGVLMAQDSNAILGFESTGGWVTNGNSSPPGFQVSSTTQRTQGNAAYAISNPANLIKVTSLPVSSTAAALAGIGDSGAMLQLDLMLPVEQGNPHNPGHIDAFVSSPSRGLNKKVLPQISFANYRPGIYNTLRFPIPDEVRSALAGAAFNDLTFEFDVSSPGKTTGTYIFDNLRVHSTPLVQNPTGQAPPPGYGGSVDVVLLGNAPVTQSFNLGPLQIPAGFHLKLGTVGGTQVQLQIGLDGSPTTTCTYGADASDNSRRSYVLTSCTSGFQAGDLVTANWAHLAINGGDSTQKIRAQLALNPLGDQAGAGLLPPMPTFWGDADSCIPSPTPGTVVTTSSSCASQTAQANQIITQYFNQVANANPSPNWIVPPTPEFALRRGDGAPNNNLTGPPPAPNDPPFDTGGDLNPGGTFDAYWRLFGNLTPTAVTGTDENKTHFEATFAAHAVLFGEDVDVMDAKVVADTDSGETTPSYKAATSTGNLGLFVFGNEIPSGGLSVNPSTGFSVDPKFSAPYDLPPIQIWIFSITLGATVDAELKASGSAALSGADLSVLPSAALGAHVTGGIDLGVASGKVDAKVNLLSVSTPVRAQIKWVINTSPSTCATTLNGSLKGDLTLSSGGGEVDLDATFGVCPFCYTDTETLVKWGPLVSKTWNLFNATVDTQFFVLPTSMCSFPATVKIVSPAAGASLSSGLPIVLNGSAAPTDTSLPYTSTYTWTYTPGANASTVSGATTGANPTVTFGAPTSGNTSTWTLNLTSTVTVTGIGGTKISTTASAPPVTVTVTGLSGGVYISQVTSANGSAVPDSNGVLQIGNGPGAVTLSGLVVGAGGTLNTTFTVAQCTGLDYAPACSTTATPVTLTTNNAASTSPSATFTGFSGGTYKVTMVTTSNGNPFGTTTVLIYGTELF
jgi:hypothetical protein